MYSPKRRRLAGQPCLTPAVHLNASVSPSCVLTQASSCAYMDLRLFSMLPSSASTSHKVCRGTESKSLLELHKAAVQLPVASPGLCNKGMYDEDIISSAMIKKEYGNSMDALQLAALEWPTSALFELRC